MTREQALTGHFRRHGVSRAARRAGRYAAPSASARWASATPTTSAAVLAALTGLAPVEELTGRGGGPDGRCLPEEKGRDPACARRCTGRTRQTPSRVLSAVGGLDLAAMTGTFLGLAAAHVPAVADGLISVVAALCAVRLCPAARDAIFLSHASKEPGYRRAAEELGLAPFLQLGMRLGEGSGCPLAFQVLKAACAVMNGMATFAEAAINDDYLESIRTPDAFRVDTP